MRRKRTSMTDAERVKRSRGVGRSCSTDSESDVDILQPSSAADDSDSCFSLLSDDNESVGVACDAPADLFSVDWALMDAMSGQPALTDVDVDLFGGIPRARLSNFEFDCGAWDGSLLEI